MKRHDLVPNVKKGPVHPAIVDGVTWMESSGWLERLGSRVAGWNLLPTLGLDTQGQIAFLESGGMQEQDFLGEWEQANRRLLRSEPGFSGNLVSGSATILSTLRPDWDKAILKHLNRAFLSPWIEAYEVRFRDDTQPSVHFMFEGGFIDCTVPQAKKHLRVGSSINELSFQHVLSNSIRNMCWTTAPPVNLTLSGAVQEIRTLARPARVILKDCPDLIRVHAIDAEVLHIVKAPKLRF